MTQAPPAVRAGRPLRAALVAPRSLGMLVLAVVLAATFAGLAQWQVSRAVENATVGARATERTVPLTRIARPAAQQTTASIGQLATARGRVLPQDLLVIGDRLNRGERGWWVVGHAVLADPAGAQLAVALGWAPSRASAERAVDAVRARPAVERLLQGRYIDSDGAEATRSGSSTALTSVSTARLVNLWDPAQTGPVYEGVLTLDAAPAGLAPIESPRPGEEVELNLLNIGYALEWTLFAFAAFYVWYRLVRDRWELEQQEAAPGGTDAAT